MHSVSLSRSVALLGRVGPLLGLINAARLFPPSKDRAGNCQDTVLVWQSCS